MFGSTEPGRKFTFDATGGLTTSDDTTCPSPGPDANTGVKFSIATHQASPYRRSTDRRLDGAPRRLPHTACPTDACSDLTRYRSPVVRRRGR